MTKNEASRLKAYIVQVVVHPHLSNVEKMEKVESFIDKIAAEKEQIKIVCDSEVLDVRQDVSA